VIGTDCRPLLVLHVSSDNQEHEQGSGEDYPTIRAHQNKPCHGWQYVWQYVRFVYPYRSAASAPVGTAITGNELPYASGKATEATAPRPPKPSPPPPSQRIAGWSAPTDSEGDNL
jgi:hypothetical protein